MFQNYQIVARNKAGEELGEFTEWSNLRFSEKLNNYGTCSFDVPVTSSELSYLLSMRRYETIIKRNGSIVWSGEQASRHGTLQVNDPNNLTITSYTFLEMLNSALTPSYVRYEATDEGAILKALVDTFQAQTEADMGFTFGDYLTSTDRSREYFTDNIMEAFINMSQVLGGPDFLISHDKVITIKPRIGIDKSAQNILEWGTNIDRVSVQESFANPCTQAVLLGAGLGSSQLRSVQTDTSARGVYGLRQQRDSEIDVSIQDTLDAKALAVLRKYKQPLTTLQLYQLPNTNPSFGAISLGDSIGIRIQEGVFDINSAYRVYGREVIIGKDGEEEISYLVSTI